MGYLESLLPEYKNLSINELEKILVQDSVKLEKDEKNFALCLVAIKMGSKHKFKFYLEELDKCTDRNKLQIYLDELKKESGAPCSILIDYEKEIAKQFGDIQKYSSLQIEHTNYILLNRLINHELQVLRDNYQIVSRIIQNIQKGEYGKAYEDFSNKMTNHSDLYEVLVANLNLTEARHLMHEDVMFSVIKRKLSLNFEIYSSTEMREFENEALRLFANLLTLNPDNEDYLNGLGQFYIKTENVKSLKELKDYQPNLDVLNSESAKALLESKDIDVKEVTQVNEISEYEIQKYFEEKNLGDESYNLDKANERLILKWLKQRSNQWLQEFGYDYAINLLMTEFYDCALYICENIEQSIETFLVQIECLIQKKEYYQAIDNILVFLSNCENAHYEMHVKYYLAEVYRKTNQLKQSLGLYREIEKVNSSYRLVRERIRELEGNQ